MNRCLKTLLLLPGLVACSQGPWPSRSPVEWTAVPRAGVRYDFAWRLSGNRQVAPVQVFDDGQHTWLQFLPGQTLPAIFAVHAGISHPVPYLHRSPYVVVQGKWRVLLLRGGHLQARVEYVGEKEPRLDTGLGVEEKPYSDEKTSLEARQRPLGQDIASHVEKKPSLTASTAENLPLKTTPTLSKSQHSHLTPTHYQANLSDENMRRVLMRWATLAGWTFTPEHWAVEVDIPLSGSADFVGDFKQAVRALLASTELGERPLQPCFYANHVLRVISISQACDRSVVRPGAVW